MRPLDSRKEENCPSQEEVKKQLAKKEEYCIGMEKQLEKEKKEMAKEKENCRMMEVQLEEVKKKLFKKEETCRMWETEEPKTEVEEICLPKKKRSLLTCKKLLRARLTRIRRKKENKEKQMIQTVEEDRCSVYEQLRERTAQLKNVIQQYLQ